MQISKEQAVLTFEYSATTDTAGQLPSHKLRDRTLAAEPIRGQSNPFRTKEKRDELRNSERRDLRADAAGA